MTTARQKYNPERLKLCAGHHCDRRMDCKRFRVWDDAPDNALTASGNLCGMEYPHFLPVKAGQ